MTGVEKQAFYFGCLGGLGHHIFNSHKVNLWDTTHIPDFPWGFVSLDTGLLKNGKHPDVYDGRVFWTCGRKNGLWFAFVWWDNSVDHRSGSNSGFYVHGFELPKILEAFDFAWLAFPDVVNRQKFPLKLQLTPIERQGK